MSGKYGLLRGLGQSMAQGGAMMAANEMEKMKEQRIRNFQKRQEQEQRDFLREQADTRYQQQEGLLRTRDDLESERMTGTAAHTGTRIEDGVQQTDFFNASGERINSQPMGPAPVDPRQSPWEIREVQTGEYDELDRPVTKVMRVNPLTGEKQLLRLTQQQRTPPPEAIQELIENAANNPAYVGFFNEYYGEEAAEQYLQQAGGQSSPGSGSGDGNGGDGGDGGTGSESAAVPEGYSLEPTLLQRAGSAASGVLSRPESSRPGSDLMRSADDVSRQQRSASDVEKVKSLLGRNMLPRDPAVAERALESGELTAEQEQVLRQYLGR